MSNNQETSIAVGDKLIYQGKTSKTFNNQGIYEVTHINVQSSGEIFMQLDGGITYVYTKEELNKEFKEIEPADEWAYYLGVGDKLAYKNGRLSNGEPYIYRVEKIDYTNQELQLIKWEGMKDEKEDHVNSVKRRQLFYVLDKLFKISPADKWALDVTKGSYLLYLELHKEAPSEIFKDQKLYEIENIQAEQQGEGFYFHVRFVGGINFTLGSDLLEKYFAQIKPEDAWLYKLQVGDAVTGKDDNVFDLTSEHMYVITSVKRDKDGICFRVHDEDGEEKFLSGPVDVLTKSIEEMTPEMWADKLKPGVFLMYQKESTMTLKECETYVIQYIWRETFGYVVHLLSEEGDEFEIFRTAKELVESFAITEEGFDVEVEEQKTLGNAVLLEAEQAAAIELIKRSDNVAALANQDSEWSCLFKLTPGELANALLGNYVVKTSEEERLLHLYENAEFDCCLTDQIARTYREGYRSGMEAALRVIGVSVKGIHY